MPTQQIPGTVDELLQFISAHSDGIDNISKQVHPILKQLPQQIFLQGTAENQDPLDLLDQTFCSLAYTYFLSARCNAERPNAAQLLNYVLNFLQDKNLGLAKQTLDAIYRRNIQQLTQTYLTLSLADIAEAVGLEGPDAAKVAENYVLRMANIHFKIESREIFATISHSHQNGMVSFHDNPEMYNTSLTITHLEQQIAKATKVSERVVKTDRAIGCSKEYLTKSQSLLATGGAMPGGLGPGDDTEFLGAGGGFDNFIDDGKYFG
ncbi:11697_t:CDS:2 [Acaulospora colombiana]|uniref:11697_t:CDS:1 n=1 Tax=Acaulospora colombiana TaxID=27376 RepID=A0ACA9K738_9GLOM|nr:11697_t:CDS:2 [Acaulospora colombiana]